MRSTFTFLSTILSFAFTSDLCLGQEKIASPNLAYYLLSATKSAKPQAFIILKDVGSQDEILSITDRINASNGIDGHSDGYCSFGARLGRTYFGRSSMAAVGFAWDQIPKRTIISFYTEIPLMRDKWHRNMTAALRGEFGPESLYDEPKKMNPNRAMDSTAETR